MYCTATYVEGRFIVAVDEVIEVNKLHYNPKIMTAWEHTIIECAIRGQVQKAMYENRIDNDQDLRITYSSEDQPGWDVDCKMHRGVIVEVWL